MIRASRPVRCGCGSSFQRNHSTAASMSMSSARAAEQLGRADRSQHRGDRLQPPLVQRGGLARGATDLVEERTGVGIWCGIDDEPLPGVLPVGADLKKLPGDAGAFAGDQDDAGRLGEEPVDGVGPALTRRDLVMSGADRPEVLVGLGDRDHLPARPQHPGRHVLEELAAVRQQDPEPVAARPGVCRHPAFLDPERAQEDDPRTACPAFGQRGFAAHHLPSLRPLDSPARHGEGRAQEKRTQGDRPERQAAVFDVEAGDAGGQGVALARQRQARAEHEGEAEQREDRAGP